MSRYRDDPVYHEQKGIKVLERDKHLRLCYALHSARPVSVSLNRHDDGLCAPGCHRPCAVWVVIQVQTHGNDFSLHLAHSGEDIGVEGVCDTVALESGDNNFFEFVTAVYACKNEESGKNYKKLAHGRQPRTASHVSSWFCSQGPRYP